MSETTLRDSFNASEPNRVPSALQDVALGELLTLVINGLTATESAVAVSSNIATLAAAPIQLFQINATSGTTTGAKKLIKGSADAAGVITPVPVTGEATWDGARRVRFAVADGATAASFTYTSPTTSSPSYLRRSLGERA